MAKQLLKKLASLGERALISNGWVLVKTMRLLHREKRLDLSYKAWDFARYSTLELCAYEIDRKKLDGAVAEVGVYQGEFAAQINRAFPNRKFYLFDTFEGFNKNDVSLDNQKGFSSGFEDFSQTSESIVLGKMLTPGHCIIKKGYFPETAAGIDDSFAFVSLDADLYKPTYDGLKFFYPRMVKGGYIFIHDFNNSLYKGVREAVDQFSQEEAVSFLPMSDIGGSAVICK